MLSESTLQYFLFYRKHICKLRDFTYEAKRAENLIIISPMIVHSKLQQQISRVNPQPTWEKGHMLRNDCPELVEEFMQVFYIHLVFFAWYTCMSATYVGHSSGESFEGDCTP